MDLVRPLVIAHRGASAHAPEHTMVAYDLGFAAGADGVECDVRLTADGELVLGHDRLTNRTSSGSRVVATSTLAQLQELDWGSWHSSKTGHQDLLTLRALLTRLTREPGEPVALIETKHPSRFGALVERRLVEMLRDYGLTVGDLPGLPHVRVMSFSVTALRRMHQLAPKVPLVQLLEYGAPRPVFRGTLVAGVQTAGVDVDFVRRNPKIIHQLQARGHAIYVWTVNAHEDVRRCIDLGVDAIITDDPAAVTGWLDAS